MSDAQVSIDTGDTVKHNPSGEQWIVAYVQNGRLSWIGWPEGEVDVDDCTLVEKVTEDYRQKLLDQLTHMQNQDDARRRYARRRLGLDKQDELKRVADDIIAALPMASIPEPLHAEMAAVGKSASRFLTNARWKALLCAGVCVEDAIAADPAINHDALLRLIANEFICAAAFFVRGLKRRAGEEISPARFALVCYGIAEDMGKRDWSGDSKEGELAADLCGDKGSLRQAIKEEVVRQSASVTDDQLRDLWRARGGDFHGPNIETATMPESLLLPFLRSLGAGPEDMPAAEVQA